MPSDGIESGFTPDDLPELPALNEVAISDTRSLLALSIPGYFTLLAVVGAVFSAAAGPKFETFGRSLAASAGLLVPLYALLLALARDRCYHCRTDAEGIRVMGLRRRSIRWADVLSAQTTPPSRWRGGRLALRTEDGGLVVAAPPTVVASAWQHLRRLGKAGGIVLPEEALTLWQGVPADVPEHVQWGKPPHVVVRAFAGVASLVFLAVAARVLVAAALQPASFAGFVLVVCGPPVVALVWLLLFPAARSGVYGITTTRDGIVAITLIGTVRMEWSSITSATWSGREAPELVMRSDGLGRELRLRHVPGSRESEQLILAVIRGIRASSGKPVAVTIPDMPSRDGAVLRRPVKWGEQRVHLQLAYLRTLDRPARVRLSVALWSEPISFFAGAGLGFVGALSGVSASLVEQIHGDDPSRAAVVVAAPVLVAMTLSVSLAFGLCGLSVLLGKRLTVKFSCERRELMEIGTGKKLNERRDTVLAAIVLAAGVLTTALYLNTFTRIDANGVSVNAYGQLAPSLYAWDQVNGPEARTVTWQCSRGHAHTGHTYEVHFGDGSVWRVEPHGDLPGGRLQRARALRLIAARKGRSLRDSDLRDLLDAEQ